MANIRVLLVDDSVEFLEEVAAYVKTLPGFEVAARAYGGAEAGELRRNGHVDLVLMALGMPGMNGLEATSRIKARPGAPLVVIATLYDSPEYPAAAGEGGRGGFVAKSDLVTALPALVAGLWKGGSTS